MPDIETIDKSNLPEPSKLFLRLEKTTNEISTISDDQYLFRLLIDKINELTAEINTLKNT